MLYTLLKPLSNFWKPKDIQIYNNVFNLHGKFTVAMLVIFSLIISAKEYFGEPIKCINDPMDKTDKTFIEYYCWIHGTYILKNFLNVTKREAIIAPGITVVQGVSAERDRIYQKYYQWVAFILVLMAVAMRVPTYMWKIWEGGRLKSVCQDFGSPLTSSHWNGVESVRIVRYLRQKRHKDLHRWYAYRFISCEVLNFFAILGVMWVLELFLHDFWFTYAEAVQSMFRMDSSGWIINTARIFPKLAKCDVYKVGVSGSMQNNDYLCLLPLNIINEKIFAILWVWMIFVFIVSAINTLCKVVIFVCPLIRLKMLYSQIHDHSDQKYSSIYHITYGGDFGQWFFLYQMSRNLNPVIFNEIISDLIKYDKEKMMNEKKKRTLEPNENHEDTIYIEETI
ncbi:innexin inx2-like [Phlebotomus argentipes]|uniref:innexin inx2-like n=1 Tax=Phlebotomus argentipes TaxID=94469 RepID=UPI00289358C3|nr:innexin inx2-like [Phlebotomus argentipes]